MTDTFELDTVRITVPVTREDTGDALDLTGADVEAVAQRRGGNPINATVVVTDAAGGIISVRWAAETFAPALYNWQVRVALNGEVQTVVNDTIVANRSIRVAT